VLWAAVLVSVTGVWVTVPDLLPVVLVGLLIVTVGFFAAHSVASSWVGRRSSLLTGGVPAFAASLYLFAYYAGSSIGGALGGVAFDASGWLGLVGYVTALLLGAVALALRLRGIPTTEPTG
jgi:YNFM family putative membrane transporter